MRSTRLFSTPLGLLAGGLLLAGGALRAQGGTSTTPPAEQTGLPSGMKYFDDVEVPTPAFALQNTTQGATPANPGALQDAGKQADAPVLDADFQSVVHTGWNSPDPAIATGPEHVVVAANGRVQVRSTTGSYVTQFSPSAMFQPLGNTAGKDLFDPQALFDVYSKRFMISYNSRETAGAVTNLLYLAISKTEDPTQGWWLYTTNLKAVGNRAGNYVAYRPRLGVNYKSIFFAATMFDPQNGTFAYTKLRFYQNKADLLSGQGPVKYWDKTKVEYYGGTTKAIYVVPAKHRSGANYGFPAVFAASRTNNSQYIYLWKATKTDDTVSGPVLVNRSVHVGTYKAADHAPQAGTTVKIRSQGVRLGNADYAYGQLRTVHSVEHDYGAGPVAALRYYDIDLKGWLGQNAAPTVSDKILFGASTRFYINPSLAYSSGQDLVIVFNSTATHSYPSVRYTGRRHWDTPGTLQSSAELKAGVAPYTVGAKSGLVNFSVATAADNNAKGRLSFVGAWARAGNSWSTWVGSVFPEHLVVPEELAGKFGNSYSSRLFANPEQRFQLIDVSQAGQGVRQITGLGFRIDNRNFNSAPAIGRKFAAKIYMAETERDQYSSIFLNNRDKARTEVFDGNITLPTIQSNITTLQGFNIASLSFNQPWNYSGASDYAMMTEFELSGGQLTNGQSFLNENYYLDAQTQVTVTQGGLQTFGKNCYDSGMASFGIATPTLEVYGAEVNNLFSNKIRAEVYGTSAKNALTYYAIGVLPYAQGVNLNACNKLYFDPLAVMPVVADNQGKAQLVLGNIPYNPMFVGARLFAQLGWGDTQTGNLILGKARARSVAAQLQSPQLWAVMADNLVTKIGNLPSYAPLYNPARSYKQ